MSVSTMYGVNGVGKDTVANTVRANHSELGLTSESRILMYLLGIAPEFGTDYTASREQYRSLEDTQQETILELKDSTFREFIGNVAAEKKPTLVLSHLVFALHLDKQTTYLTDQPIPGWYLDAGNAFINLVAPPAEILKRRIGELAARERPADGVAEVETHQDLCNRRWDQIVYYVGSSAACRVINNTDPLVASTEVWEAIHG